MDVPDLGARLVAGNGDPGAADVVDEQPSESQVAAHGAADVPPARTVEHGRKNTFGRTLIVAAKMFWHVIVTLVLGWMAVIAIWLGGQDFFAPVSLPAQIVGACFGIAGLIALAGSLMVAARSLSAQCSISSSGQVTWKATTHGVSGG